MSDNTGPETINLPASIRLKQWFGRPLGRLIHEHECRILDGILPELFGYHFMQIGTLFGHSLFESTRIGHRIVVQLDEGAGPQEHANLLCPPDSLPFLSDSMDVIVLPHVLEYVPNPHKLLRETERVLIGEGHVVITGFNPWSLCGLWRVLLAWRDEPPWSGHFFSYHRLNDWFSLLDLEVVRIQRSFYRPPIANPKLLQRLSFVEKLGKFCWSIFGGIYIIVLRKRVVPLTPVKLTWHKRRRMIEAGLAEPTIRGGQPG